MPAILDKELLNNLLKVYWLDGPPPDGCDFQTADIADCFEALVIVAFLTNKGIETQDISSSVGAALQVGIEVGYQYAEMTRNK